jgi:hypothetical protein
MYARYYRGVEAGDTLPIPEERETDVERVGTPEVGSPDLVVSVIGRGERTPYVVLRTDADGEVSVPDGSVVLGSDPWTDTLWYAVRRSAYGGDAA